jgi:O-antigen/teichoic acid export membrane protein
VNYPAAAGLTFATKILTIGLSAVSSIALARWLGTSGRGEYTLITLVPTIVVTLANMGIGTAALHLVAREPRLFPIAATNSLLVAAIGGTGAAAIAFALSPRFFGSALTSLNPGVQLALLGVPAALLLPLMQSLLQSIRSFRWSSFVSAGAYLLLLILLAIFVGFLNGGLLGAVIAWVIATNLAAVLAFVVAISRGGIGRPDLSFLVRTVRYGIWSYAGAFAWLVMTRGAVFIAGFLLPASAVGIFAVALSLAELLWLLADAAGSSIAPFIASEQQRHAALTPTVTRLVLAVTTPTAILLGIAASPIVNLLYGTDFAGAADLTRVLLPGVLAHSCAKILAGDLLGRGRPDVNLVSLGIGAGGTIMLSFALIPVFGIMGAATATAAAYVSSAVIQVVGYVRVTRISWPEMFLLTGNDLRTARRIARLRPR